MFQKLLFSILVYVRRKAQRLSLLLYLPANSSLPECDCSFLFMFHQTAEMVLREKIYKKDYFLLRLWSIESGPDLSLPPCIFTRMRSSLVRMRSSLVVRASDCQCTSCNGPGFDPSIRLHSGIWGVADEAVLNIVWKRKKIPQKNILELKNIP